MAKVKTKKCSHCKQDLKLKEFYKNACKKDGLQDNCKVCQKEFVRNYYEKNKDSILSKLKQKSKRK